MAKRVSTASGVAGPPAIDPNQTSSPGDPEVRTLFTELRDEASEHVGMLQEEMAKLSPSASVEAEYDPDDAPYL